MEDEDLTEIEDEEEPEAVLDPEPDPRRRRSRRRRSSRRRRTVLDPEPDPRRRRTSRRRRTTLFSRRGSSWMPAIKTAAAVDLGAIAGKFVANKFPTTLNVAGHAVNAPDLAAGVLGFLAHGIGMKHGTVINEFGQGMLSAAIGADPGAPSSQGMYTAGPIPLPVSPTGL